MNPDSPISGTLPRVCLVLSAPDAPYASVRAAIPVELEVTVVADPQHGTDLDEALCIDAPVEAAAALRAAAAAHPGHDWLLIDARAELPESWWPRLQDALKTAPEAIISPLCSDRASFDPRPPRRRGELPWDALIWLYAERTLVPTATWSRLLSYWPQAAVAGIEAALHVPVESQGLLCTSLFVAGIDDTRAAEPGPVVAALRQRLLECEDARPPRPGLDQRPVLLHVLHGWGGGAERFVRDYSAADRRFQHLVLRALNDPDRRQPGRSLALFYDLDKPPIRHWPLNLPIESTALNHPEYQQVLRCVIKDYSISALLISSLIGHSLDALRSGLPTAAICHDYYPAWPILHADFGDASLSFSSSAIATALDAARNGFPFSERRPAWWQGLRRVWVETLQRQNVQLIAPSAGVQANLCRIEPSLRKLPWQVIPHGLASWPAKPGWSPETDRLRLLVPGRIKGGKGEHLLAQLIPHLPDDVELILLGAGDAGMRFFGQRNVHVLLDYVRDELPLRIAALRPRAALLLSTVAETFSYALSEMQSLGVPVIATRRGSFVERIQDGEDGLLVEPTIPALLGLIDELRQGRRALPAPRFDAEQSSLQAMAARYADLLQSASSPPAALAPVGLSQVQRDQQQIEAVAARAEASATRHRLLESLDEAEARAHWARSQARLAEQRLQWATGLNEELSKTRRDWQSAEEQRQALDVELQSAHSELNEAELALQESRRWVQALIQQRDEFETERNAILASTSWRITAPIRVGRRLLARWLTRARFQLSRMLSLRQRGLRSLKTRGLNGTLRRLRNEFDTGPGTQYPALQVPASKPDFSIEGIGFAAVDAPRASVVIPVYNHLDHTLTCLRSITEQGAALPFEVIVVDDGSSDRSAELLPTIPGLVFHRNAQNLGFIGACNAGAGLARGEFVVFLNNDTAVQPGWLDALIATFEQHAQVGLVGAKLVYPDGRLQEAGGIVFADGSGWNYGRFDDPADPRYNFVREVDYCSGAAIALRKSLFDQFGGFDSHYAPAYYEDTDLAMKVRAAGLRVLFQPRSVVVHFEGISSGTDLNSGTKRYQVINQSKFMARWSEALKAHPAAGTDIQIARQHRCQRRVLVVDATTPQPDQDSGSVRLVNLLRLLLEEGCAVTFFADNRAWVERYSSDLQQIGIEVLWHPFLANTVDWIEKDARRFDCIIVSRHYILCNYLDLLRQHAPKARLVFDTVDLHYLREQRAADLAGREDLQRSAAQTRLKELGLIKRADVTLVVSPVEQELLAREAPQSRVDVLSNVHEVFGCRRPFEQRRDLMFVGGFQHPPNIDAVQWFVGEVFPLIRAKMPDVVFHIIGSKAPPELAVLGQQPGVQFHGYVEDIRPFLDECRLAIAPLRYGAGVKGKINMSMSYGQPVVATPMAVEGMYLRAGEDVLVGADAATLAGEVLRAYADAELWQRLSDNGLANVEQHFSFDAARRAVRRLLDD